jgi:hypothetical protein
MSHPVDPRRTLRSSRACRPAIVMAITLIAAFASTEAGAKVYRCGNVFQDQPCPEVKVADARPVAQVQVVRDLPECYVNGREASGRAECINAKATRENQQLASEPKR